jgi:phosphatidylglycerol---prolipoprotein diacylglyceryl transferase
VNVPHGLLAFIPPPPTNGIKVGPLFFHFYGICIAIGILAAVSLARRRWAAAGGDPADLERPLFWGIVAGFVGGRLAYVSTHLASFDGRPWAVVAIWEGGLALYGGLTLGILVGLWVTRRRGLPMLRVLDAVVPAIPLAQAFGRWGNYFNQELFGTPSTLPWALRVEPEHVPARYEGFETFHPTFLYESLWNLVVVVVLLQVSRRVKLRPGSLLLCYGILYGTGRFLLELLRTDTVYRLFGLSRNAYVSLAVVLGSAVLLVLRERRRPAGAEDADAAEDDPDQPRTAEPALLGGADDDDEAGPERRPEDGEDP